MKAVKDAAAEAKATAVKAQEKVVAEVKEVAKTAATVSYTHLKKPDTRQNFM